MGSRLEFLTGRGFAEASSFRGEVAEMARAERNAAAGGPGFASVAEYAAALARRSVCLTLLAGSGSRWIKSLAARIGAAGASGAGQRFDPARPRGLYPVRDFLLGGDTIPVAAYALAAVDGLGRHLLVVRGWEAEIDAELLAPLGIGPGDRDFFTQGAPYGKPLGHGDAAWQARSLWRGADYVVTNFGGDANSRRTILSSLLALDALRAMGTKADALIPAAPLDSPAYPIGLDEDGLPSSFGHAKLQGRSAAGGLRAPGSASGAGYTNVGVRVYSAAALLEKVESFRRRHWVEGRGYAIPGNDPEGREFALDNVDAELATEGRARILAIGRPEELTPAKSLEEVPAFERAARAVVAEDAALTWLGTGV
ncbi:MAG: hypothetical protein ABSF43_12660 [Rectinemataceae bacterium]|jgi:hypothetical protein